MLNRIAALLRDHVAAAPQHAPALDWSYLIEWLPALDRARHEETSVPTIDCGALRDAFRKSGVLIWDGPAWIEAEGGLRAAIQKAYHRDLAYLRNTLSALYYADEKDPEHFPVAIRLGVMFALIRRAHTLETTMQVIEELITGGELAD
jgi:hypothetical protein